MVKIGNIIKTSLIEKFTYVAVDIDLGKPLVRQIEIEGEY